VARSLSAASQARTNESDYREIVAWYEFQFCVSLRMTRVGRGPSIDITDDVEASM
jgi:hypothetical protein